MSAGDRNAAELVQLAEKALTRGEPETARAQLDVAISLGIDEALTARFVNSLAKANRFLSRHRDTVAWIEARLREPHEPATRAMLLCARVGALRQVDTGTVLELAEEALEAARAVGDHESFANVLAHASFCAYRRGDARLAMRYAGMAAERQFPTLAANIDGLRAQMFAATASDAMERSLDLSRRVRDGLLELGDGAGAANECNNIAEALLQLGYPEEAREEAIDGAEMAARAGHRAAERFAYVLIGRATAELGELEDGICRLRAADVHHANVPFLMDAAAARSFWLVERGAAGDPEEARLVVTKAVDAGAAAGVTHCLTQLLATLGRALSRLGDEAEARDALARARAAADAADATSELHLALSMAEVLAAGDPARRAALGSARARLLRDAGKRENPWAFCTSVRLHRRLLELSGGVPTDLPRGA